jgi:surface protein
METVIDDNNIRPLINAYFINKNSLPQDLQNKTLNEWDVSNVTNMSNLFIAKNTFNEELNEWDVSNVTNMSNLFVGCTNFNKPLNNWNVSNVTSMTGMFAACQNFNQPLNNWNVSNVTNMICMFIGCQNFNKPLNNWTLNPLVRTENIFLNCRIEENNKPVLPPPPIAFDSRQVHKAAAKIKYPELNNFLLEKTEDPLPNNLNFPNYINDTINRIINESDEPEEIKTVQRNGLQRIMNERLNRLQYNYLSPNVKNSIFNCLNYVKLQSPIFKKTYVETFIKDCVHAYEGADGMSCANGALERIVFSLLPACAVEDNPDCETIIDLIQGKGGDIKNYIRDWYKLHKNLSSSSNADPFPSDETGRRANLRQYLLEKLPGQEALIDDTIENFADHIGYEDDAFDVSFGGRRRKTMKRRKKMKRRKTMKQKRTMKRRRTNKRRK